MPNHSDDVHRRAIHLYVHQKYTASRIVNHFKLEGTIVPLRTVYNWIERYDARGQIENQSKHHFKHHQKISDRTILDIVRIQESHNEYTLHQIHEQLPDPKPSIASISRVLINNHFLPNNWKHTLKRKTIMPQKQNALNSFITRAHARFFQ